MSLTDKVIKNTVYYFISQVIGFIFPLFLTPFIISKIGTIQFGIYAIVLGFTGTIGLFDLSVSSSFIKFISEYFNKKDYTRLNNTINSGLFFYIIFALIFCIIGFLFAKPLLSLLNIPDDLRELSLYAFKLSLLTFFISNAFIIFTSILISLQKMYLTSILGIGISTLSFAVNIVLLIMGYGLKGLLWTQFITICLNVMLSIIIAKRSLPEMRLGINYFNWQILKKMTGFGIQMQVSKLASLASEKYDEFLLAFFSVMNNVTFYNISGRVARFGRFFPYQLIPQVAPVAAELNAKNEEKKLPQLFTDTSKYLTLLSLPIFTYIIIFSDSLLLAWMGPGYELSAYLLRILAIGQLINLIFSAPGNSITPNIGLPKYQMREGLINLGFNLVLSYLLIKYYGIIGAAIGVTIAMIVSSLYVFAVSSDLFKQKQSSILTGIFLKPFIICLISGAVSYLINLFCKTGLFSAMNRGSGIILTLITGFIFMFLYSVLLANSAYMSERDKTVIVKMILKILPVNLLIKKDKTPTVTGGLKTYNNEKVSLFIVTYNRVEMLKKCLNSLLPSLKGIDYELLIWDNNSMDGTKEFLSNYSHTPHIKLFFNNENIGTTARGKLVEMTKGVYIIGIDDDVIQFPVNWVQDIIYAYNSIPNIGFLSTDVIQDETTDGAKQPDDSYLEEEFENGKLKLLIGPAGGWCFIISRKVYNEVGKFYYPRNRIFFPDDGDYSSRVLDHGCKTGILKDLKVYHATGAYHNKQYTEIFKNKIDDYNKGNGNLYHLKRKIQKILFIKRYTRRFLELASKQMEGT